MLLDNRKLINRRGQETPDDTAATPALFNKIGPDHFADAHDGEASVGGLAKSLGIILAVENR